MGKRLRLDLVAFQAERRAGVTVLALILVAAAVASYALAMAGDTASSYLGGVGRELRSAEHLEAVIRGGKPVAVMFESPTCPVCKKMKPFWLVLEERSDRLPVSFYHIVFGPETAEAFRRYGVTETPTFIVFSGGRPVARHVGAFEAENVTEAMLAWALAAVGLSLASNPEQLASEGLEVYQAKCASCHGPLEGLDPEDLRAWLERGLAEHDLLARRLSEAVMEGRLLSELYGGYGRLSEAVASMRKYVDLTSYEVDRATYLLEYASAVLAGREPPRLVTGAEQQLVTGEAGEATPLQQAGEAVGAAVLAASMAAAAVAGLVSAFSPCVLPVLVAYVAGLAGSRLNAASCMACSLAAFAGSFAFAAVFALAGTVVTLFQQALIPVVASAVIGLGFASLTGVPAEFNALLKTRGRGVAGFCTVYGVLAVQCNLPLVVGALLLAAGAGGSGGLVVAAAFAAGLAVPLGLALLAASRLGPGVLSGVLRRTRLLNLVGGSVLVAAGVYLLAYGLGLV